MHDITFFNHTPGDGPHYVNCNFKWFSDGDYQFGDTSENCIIAMADAIVSKHRLGTFVDIWNATYPTDTMSNSDLVYVIASALPYISMDKFAPLSPDDIEDVLDDLRSIQLDALAARIKDLLANKYSTE